MTDFNIYLQDKKIIVEQRLRECTDIILQHTPLQLKEAMLYSLFAGGKRLRPILTYAAAESLGGNLQDALTAGCAIEFIHTYSLIHDDLPAMDDDDYRRGKLTNHKKFGEGMAILAGDALLTEAFNIITNKEFFENFNYSAILDITNFLAQCAGANGMVGGQSLDLIYENACAGESVVEEIHINKTAKLIIASIFAGARLSTNNSHIINKFKKFAFNIGLAFQIIDDILDITVSMEQLGKSKSDKKKNKTTYPSVFGLDRSKEIADNLTAQAKKEIDFLKEKGAVLNSLTDFIIERIN
jgi:geranylgeranyl diphosphate synthase type II